MVFVAIRGDGPCMNELVPDLGYATRALGFLLSLDCILSMYQPRGPRLDDGRGSSMASSSMTGKV